MKKFTMVLTLTVAAALLLSGCAASGQAGSAASSTENGVPVGTPGSRQPGELSQEMKLALGTLKLEGTENAVTAEQAAKLLPLWKAARSLSGSDSAAADEIRGLFSQIEKTMSAEQLEALDAMQIGMQDMGALAEKFGIQMVPQGGLQGTPNAELQATMEAMRATRQASGESLQGGPGGGFGGPPPGGGMGPGMGGPGMGGSGMESGLSEEARATAMAQRGGGGGARIGVPSGLTEAIITLLEARLAE